MRDTSSGDSRIFFSSEVFILLEFWIPKSSSIHYRVILQSIINIFWGRCDRNRIIVGFVTTYAISDKVCQWLATGWWFSPGTPVSFTIKTDHHFITEILLKVVLNTITLTLTLLMIFLFSRDGMLKRNKVKTEWILKPQKEYSKLLKFD